MARKKVELVNLMIDGKSVLAKACTKCNVVKPLDEFHNSSDGSAGGKQPICKACKRLIFKNSYTPSENVIRVDKIIVDGIEVDAKVCRRCSILKPLSEYYNMPYGGIGGKRANCKPCDNEISQDWKNRNRDKLKTYDHDRWWNNKESEKIRKLKSYDPVKSSARYKKWSEENKDRVYLKNINLVAKKKNLQGTLKLNEFNEILEFFDYKCALTGSTKFELDHFIAIHTGKGGTFKGNIVPITKFLNNSKKNRNPFEWIKWPHIQEMIMPGSFEKLISYLAETNGMSVDDYRDYVYKCYGDES